MTAVDHSSRAWLPLPSQGSGMRLFCLPHAGGAASAFRSWVGRVPGAVVLPVQLPGREGRFQEGCHAEMSQLVAEFATLVADTAAGAPFLLYGHSLGALTAFETARELRRRGAAQPVHLVVSGSPAPHKCRSDGLKVSTLSDAELAAEMRRMGGTAEWLLADAELRTMIFPAVRADFAMRERYRYQEEAPLDLPITVVASDRDHSCGRRVQARWSAQTLREFRMHSLPGAHFAVFEQEATTLAYLADAVRRSVPDNAP